MGARPAGNRPDEPAAAWIRLSEGESVSQSTLGQMQAQLAAAAPGAEVTFRPMFGGACGYVRGRVFASLSDVGLALKLGLADQDELLSEKGAKRLQYEPDAPVSRQYVVVPPRIWKDAAALGRWVKRSIDHVLTLPAPKPRRKKLS
jgi:TfoX/Sxy family transcriptional regulator of competence genes